LRFQQYGQTYQLQIASAEDLGSILTMDESLWMATSAPVPAFRCDSKLLALLDADGNGRIHSDELKAAIRWLLDRLSDTSKVAEGADVLPLSFIRADAPDGQALIDSARYILDKQGPEPGESISLGQVRSFLGTIQSRPLNGDGIIVPEAGDSPEMEEFLRDAVGAMEGTQDASGRKGLSGQQLNDFLAAVPAHLEWRQRGQLLDGETESGVMPFGIETAQLCAVCRQHADEVDLFFELCRLAGFDARTQARLAGLEAHLQHLDPVSSEQVNVYLQNMPIATAQPSGVLPLAAEMINPLYRGWLRDLTQRVLPRVLDRTTDCLTEAEWRNVKAAFAPYEAYIAQKQGQAVEKLPTEKLQRYADPSYAERARRMVECDKRVAGILQQAQQVERLLLFHCHLVRFANNFVSFPQLYAEDQTALFEMGTLVMDGRWFSFAVNVENLAGHSAVAKQSNLLVMYVEVAGTAAEKFTIALPVTSGTKGNLAVGKRGVFFDVSGREYDARIVQIIDNPVSVREALGMPFVRLWRLVEGKIETWSGAAEKDFITAADKAVVVPGSGAVSKPPAPPKPGASPLPGNAFIGIGVVTAALGSAFAFVTKTFAGMSPGHILWGFLGAASAVMLPVALIAVLKLRRQDVSSLLEGAGWAINARMRLNRGQRRHFTRVSPFPEGAEGTPRRVLLRWLLVALVALLLLSVVLHVFINA